MKKPLTHAVVLAAGRGSRLAEPRPGVTLSPAQEAAAATGLKALMPVPERPFLDHGLAALEAVGIRRFGIVLGRHHEPLRRHLATLDHDLTLLEQPAPRGTADALLAAEDFTGDQPFLALNADTYYPPAALSALVSLTGPGLLALDRDQVLASEQSNLTDAKLCRFALVASTPDGGLLELIEKPDAATWAAWLARPEPVRLSINAFRFAPSIYSFCRRVPPSPRGEFELPAAVALAVAAGEPFTVAVTGAPVLDLTERSDVAVVSRTLACLERGEGR
ncbi:MAG: NTP transferase domain-containing protein [Thermoanaerobaculia bacterium]|nr:NTP transferase domain-containing protein [Thermoanaerobaculia bacterium]